MSWEMFKSLLLSVLIALSLVLTWHLWNFHSRFQPLEELGYVQSNVSSQGRASINDVVYPLQVMFHDGSTNVRGTNATGPIQSMMDKVTKATYSHVKQRNGKAETKKFTHQVKAGSVTLIFPRALSISLFEDMLQTKADHQDKKNGLGMLDSDLMFDRLSFHKTPNGLRAIFMNGHDLVATAKTDGLAYEALHDFKNKSTGTFVSKALADGPVQLPNEAVRVKKIFYYSYQWLDVDKFKTALFRDPHDVLREGDYFTNGATSLKETNHTIKYVNPGSGSGKDNTESEDNSSIIQDSFDYINSHSGWNNPYVMFDYDPPVSHDRFGGGTVTFRLMAGQKQSYPVFADVSGNNPYRDAGTILLNWQEGDVHLYARTLLDLPKSADRGTERKLESGVAVLNKLKASDEIQNDQIRDLHIGYQMDYPPNPNTLILTPRWFVKYGEAGHAEWKQVDALINPGDGDGAAREEDAG